MTAGFHLKRFVLTTAVVLLCFSGVAWSMGIIDLSRPKSCSDAVDKQAFRSVSAAATEEGRRIVKCKLIDGFSRKEVERALGEPGERGGREWAYLLGPETGPFAMDSHFLHVSYTDGSVTTTVVDAG